MIHMKVLEPLIFGGKKCLSSGILSEYCFSIECSFRRPGKWADYNTALSMSKTIHTLPIRNIA